MRINSNQHVGVETRQWIPDIVEIASNSGLYEHEIYINKYRTIPSDAQYAKQLKLQYTCTNMELVSDSTYNSKRMETTEPSIVYLIFS